MVELSVNTREFYQHRRMFPYVDHVIVRVVKEDSRISFFHFVRFQITVSHCACVNGERVSAFDDVS